MDVLDIGYLKKLINSIASGFKSQSTTQQADGSYKVIITWNDNTTSEFIFNQYKGETEIDITTPSTTWLLQHNLNTPWYELSVLIIDSDNNRTYGNVDVDNCTDNVFMLKFDEPISGKAIVKK